MTFVLSKFKTNLLIENHSVLWERTWFGTEHKSPTMFEIITLVSSANNTGSNLEFIHLIQSEQKF
jgi:hypothetical protein